MKEWIRSYWVTYVRMSRRERRHLVEVIRTADTQSFEEVERPSTTIDELVALAELMEAARQVVLRRQQHDDPAMERLAAAVLVMGNAIVRRPS